MFGAKNMETDLGMLAKLSKWAEDLYIVNSGGTALRGAIFTTSQLEVHAKALAETHIIGKRCSSDVLLNRHAKSEKIINTGHDLMDEAYASGRRLEPAAEWLLDNFYLIEEQFSLTRKHFPRSYSKQLPYLMVSEPIGVPRIYNVISQFILHVDGLVDEESLSRYIRAYQEVTHLTLGELWSVAIMLRLALIENLGKIIINIAWQQDSRDSALQWAKKINEAGDKNYGALILVLGDLVKENPPLSIPFVSQFTQALQGRGTTTTFMLAWLEQRLSEQGQTLEEIIRAASQNQASGQESMANTINSLRFINNSDWRAFVDFHSITEKILRTELLGIYPKMDFATRDQYRHAVETMSRKFHIPEEEIANATISQANTSFNELPENVAAHVGYVLVDEGKINLQRIFKKKWNIPNFSLKTRQVTKLVLYLLFMLILAMVFLVPLLSIANPTQPIIRVILIICAFMVVLQTSIKVINWIISLIIKPQPLPRMDFEKGIPDNFRTMVVVPAMLTVGHSANELIEDLELRYIANRDPNIWFALLTDFSDAECEIMPHDEELLNTAIFGIEELNRKYTSEDRGRFFLFHRPRIFNPQEETYMGRERKRGKLEDFNAFVCGENRGCFSAIIGDTSEITSIKYVITLDTDTKLPWGAAWRLIGTAAHPLNQPCLNTNNQHAYRGYVIIQPRISTSIHSAHQSYYSSLLAGEVGLDPYTRVASDLYQDLFAEASFIGKGIYDVRIFQEVLDGRFPTNAVLSHDLLESCYARTALCSDVELLENTPASYLSDTLRRHRWMRGDWQITPWLGLRLKNAAGKIMNLKPTLLGYWKILDNLRRALLMPSYILLLTVGWLTLANPLLWTAWIFAFLFLPEILRGLSEILQYNKDFPVMFHLAEVKRATVRRFLLVFLEITFLPFETAVAVDAMVRALWRMLISHRHLLEWQTAAAIENAAPTSLLGITKRMWPVVLLPMAMMYFLLSFKAYMSMFLIGPILLAWFVSPVLVWWISLPLRHARKQLNHTDLHFLRYAARLTWRYFEDFVNAQDNWLPPDNFQQSPHRIAHRTSPTNIGLSLLSNLTAYDMGYLTVEQLLDRTQHTIEAMEQLERYRGHFLNWYDTHTLKPLRPVYVSTVDSGNLIGHIRVLQTGLLELKSSSFLSPEFINGLKDTFHVLITLIKPVLTVSQHNQEGQRSPFDVSAINAIEVLLQEKFITLSNVDSWLIKLQSTVLCLVNSFERLYNPEAAWWVHAFHRQVQSIIDNLFYMKQTPDRLEERYAQIDMLVERLTKLIDADFSFLYNKNRKLMVIGYSVTDRRLDNGFYDLLASEASLASFINIASGQLPAEHWFALGRRMTNSAGKHMLLSWSGSMFEVLMPLLVMPSYSGTLLENTYKGTVARQIEYGRYKRIPWGISESGYNITDAEGNYQYRSFGVPGLGLQRGLGEELVIAPYATSLALLVDPQRACSNLRRMSEESYLGTYGFYEAIDFTRNRMQQGERGIIIKSFMAHHNGMSLVAFAHVILGPLMQRRFLNNPDFRATALLLQERLPKENIPIQPLAHETPLTRLHKHMQHKEQIMRIISTPNGSVPALHLLSNGNYRVMVTASGSGCSCYNDISITRWREDSTLESLGIFYYIADTNSNHFWTNSFQPSLRAGNHYEAIFTPGRAEFRRQDEKIETHTEIAVSPEDNIEVRRLTLTNRSETARNLTITSYAEAVLAPGISDELHRVFSNLFVQAELDLEHNAILMTRRPRSLAEKPAWIFCTMQTKNTDSNICTYETDRAKFIGRGNTLRQPTALNSGEPLSNTAGSTLDPCLAIRRNINLPIDHNVRLDLIIGVAPTRAEALALIIKYQDHRMADRVFETAPTHSRAVRTHIGATEAQTQLFQELAAAVIFAVGAYRSSIDVIRRNRKGQSGLWGYSISGDFPIVLLRVTSANNIELVRELLIAHAFWRAKGLITDLVIWNDDASGYRQDLHAQIFALIGDETEAQLVDKPGGIFVRHMDVFPEEDRVLLQAAARIIIHDVDGPLRQQLARWRAAATINRGLLLNPTYRARVVQDTGLYPPSRELTFFNETGGFSKNGQEYIIELKVGRNTPAPWVNVIANPHFGTVVSESGSSYTWFENAQLYRLTPWHNDPVCDPSGELLYIRDEETGAFFSPTPSPTPRKTPYVCRHGFGYTIFEHAELGYETELTTFVAINAPVKFTTLKIRNIGSEKRVLNVFSVAELVLGDLRSRHAMHVTTEIDPSTGALLARNTYNSDFSETVVFFDSSEASRHVSCDRTEFFGRNGSIANPSALHARQLSGQVGQGMDPCAAMQVRVELEAGAEKTIVFILGAASKSSEVLSLLKNFRGVASAHIALEAVRKFWDDKLGILLVDSPDPAINIMLNGWLPYQILSCRLWGRSGFYQSGGAFGYRDQLQDCAALLHQTPELVRQQIIKSASRQFVEGDVQHWWHAHNGRGVRTRCSDDYLWLPYVVAQYVKFTGDTGVLDEKVSYLTGRLLNDKEESYYDLPNVSDQQASVYDHCMRAINYGLKFGTHGLALMGSGDWNDGMDKVGHNGTGESVWLSFFLNYVLTQFAEIADGVQDKVFAEQCRVNAAKVAKNIEKEGWDGQWYKRAYFDNGEPLGSIKNPECQIDSLPQSWAVISGVGSKDRHNIALDSAWQLLVKQNLNMVQLFTPPFNNSSLEPGYIKGYPPGIRENGGQYTHAAAWLALAYAFNNKQEQAYKLCTMLNPITHTQDDAGVKRYKVEPYVQVADIYSESPHAGMGGWSWYTGSAGWFYRLFYEGIFGIERIGESLYFTPRVPSTWSRFRVNYRYYKTLYSIIFTQDLSCKGQISLVLDGQKQEGNRLKLISDEKNHTLEIHFYSQDSEQNNQL